MISQHKTYLLCILDGLGFNPRKEANAFALAKTPNLSSLLKSYPNTTLVTHGERVGLPAGQMGNSEVGHLNIGAGRVVEQWLLRIGKALKSDFLEQSKEYQDFVKHNLSARAIHLVGLYSDGGVHSHCDHLHLFLKKLISQVKGEIFLHLITDGRDTSPKRFAQQIPNLLSFITNFPRCKIASVCGRFYAMDRDKRWERTQKAYDVFAKAKAETCSDLLSTVESAYAQGTGDEFLEPLVISPKPMQEGDGIVFWNFREDRIRQIVSALCIPKFSYFDRNFFVKDPRNVLCFTDYDHSFKLPYIFPPLFIKNHLGDVISQKGFLQLRTAETEKYAHVTYFFNGGIEKEYPGETRILIPSPREVKTYDQKPEMSAYEVTEVVVKALREKKYALIVVNLANCDMVGHTGVLQAAIKAVETVDTCTGKIVKVLEEVGGEGVIIADHGNAEQMINYEDGTPHTSHTTYPVPMIVVGRGNDSKLKSTGSLCDIAPSILYMMGIPKPKEMTGESLIQ